VQRGIVTAARRVGEVWVCYNQRLVPMMSAGVAFWFLLGLIPFLFLTTAISGYVFRRNPEALQNLGDALLALLPPGLGEGTLTQLHITVSNWQTFGLLGIVALFFVSMGLFEALDWGINGAMGTRKKVGFLKGRLVFLAYLLGAITFFSLAAVADYLFKLMMAAPALAEFAQRIYIPRRTVSMASFFVFLLILYMLVPVRTPRFARAVAVALGASAIWALLQYLGAEITVYVSRRRAIYGALAGGALFLWWMYLLASIILVGGTVLDVWQRHGKPPPPLPGDE
jgi:YihY family inner membrane protein